MTPPIAVKLLVGAENGGGGFSNKNCACAELREVEIVKSVNWIGHIVLGKFQRRSKYARCFSFKKKKRQNRLNTSLKNSVILWVIWQFRFAEVRPVWLFSKSLCLQQYIIMVYYQLKTLCLRVLTLALSLTAPVTSSKSFSPDFLFSQRTLPVNPNSPSLSLLSGQKGIVHANMHTAASDQCLKAWER